MAKNKQCEHEICIINNNYYEDYGTLTYEQCVAGAVCRGVGFKQYMESHDLSERFNFCPKCGEKIDWDELMKRGEEEVATKAAERAAEIERQREEAGLPF